MHTARRLVFVSVLVGAMVGVTVPAAVAAEECLVWDIMDGTEAKLSKASYERFADGTAKFKVQLKKLPGADGTPAEGTVFVLAPDHDFELAVEMSGGDGKAKAFGGIDIPRLSVGDVLIVVDRDGTELARGIAR